MLSQGTSSTNSDGYVNYFNFTLTPHKVMICQLKRKLKTGGITNLRLAWAIGQYSKINKRISKIHISLCVRHLK